MANEDKKDFNAMLRDSKDMPKVQIVTDPATIEKYGGTRMYFAPPRGRKNLRYYVQDFENALQSF